MEQSPCWAANSSLANQVIPSSLQHSEEPATWSCPEPYQSSSGSSPIIFCKVNFNTVLQSLPWSSKWSLSRYPAKTLYAPNSTPIPAACLVHINLLRLITWIIIGEEHKSWSSFLCSLLLCGLIHLMLLLGEVSHFVLHATELKGVLHNIVFPVVFFVVY